ncbi:helix-turn-helix domain-containing protein [Oceanirhabdus sp. W0125-5]|uniref:helix-turn-helix domain-containing protein n=1 Tax=Oceanirhabdus sp. W0125-5 TaxID=2999116 RepID=UPI0022F2CB3E|nr:helix-turn-helix domain-containing protein [Oceanirhabdus sp. W0125-5]WBW96695.1 AraC family transcriptional regulator [Oceanirhabdus sp. W0125-5]
MSDYYKKLQKSLDYIEEHIKEDISLEDLSALCYYSTHHYHRVFQSVIGIPVTDYIRKRKLSVAAKEIIETDKKIIDIAMDYGFNSHETFSRAFKRIFDITPNAYRKMNAHAIPADFWKVSFKNSDLQKRYMEAVETLCKRLKNDVNVLAVLVMGSLSYDQVWEKSDIDMAIIVNDNCKLNQGLCLIEDEIYINGEVMTRSEFRKIMAKSLQGSWKHSYFSLGTIVYCTDESIRELFESNSVSNDIGERDKYYALLERLEGVLNSLYKAEKWLKIKSDVRYSYVWVIETLKHIAAIEVLMNNNIPSREVIQQALKYNNPIIEKLYKGLMDERKNSINISQAIEMIYEYLRQHKEIICKPIIDYFDKANKMKALSTIVQDFNKSMRTSTICEVCEWLCEEGVLVKDISETQITNKSNTIVYEPAYFKVDVDMEIIL